MIKDDHEKDAATVMMADLLFRKNDFTQALAHIKKLLHTKPDHYSGLERVIQLLRRAGKLEECPQFLEMAEKSSSRATLDAGFNYCKGLYEWYIGNPNVALKHFNKARKDTDYGTAATYNMIEICLNPDNETLGGEVFKGGDVDHGMATEKADSEMVGIKTAERFLRELKPKLGDLRHGILLNMLLIATKVKSNIEKALANFLEMCNTEKQNIGALHGSAVAYMILKQSAKAQSQLKHAASATWNVDDADDLEKSWLLLADINIMARKSSEAVTFLKLCLEHNKSCCKAYEYMGHIMETEQNVKEATANYELAWKYGNQNNPAIGYKLAFNYMKEKKYVPAIETCHQVLSTHPTYPMIRKDVLEKARMQLRT
jgi:tetratricopeptide repeat protein 21B